MQLLCNGKSGESGFSQIMKINVFLTQVMLLVQVIASDGITPQPSTKEIYYIQDLSPTPLCSKLDFCGRNAVLITETKGIISANTCSTLITFDAKLTQCCKEPSLPTKMDVCHLENCTEYLNNWFADFKGIYNLIRISYTCVDKKEEDSTEENDFPIAGYVVIGLVMALVVIVGLAGLVIWRRKKHRVKHERDTPKPATNPAYDTIDDTTDDSDRPDNILEPENYQDYSEIGLPCNSCGKAFDVGQSTDYNKLNLRFPKLHRSSAQGFESATAYNDTFATYSHTNEIVPAKTNDTYNHLDIFAAQAVVNVDNTYNIVSFTGEGNDRVGVDMMDNGEYSHIGAIPNGEAASLAKDPKSEGSDKEYFAFENQTYEDADKEGAMKRENHDYYILEKTQ